MTHGRVVVVAVGFVTGSKQTSCELHRRARMTSAGAVRKFLVHSTWRWVATTVVVLALLAPQESRAATWYQNTVIVNMTDGVWRVIPPFILGPCTSFTQDAILLNDLKPNDSTTLQT